MLGHGRASVYACRAAEVVWTRKWASDDDDDGLPLIFPLHPHHHYHHNLNLLVAEALIARHAVCHGAVGNGDSRPP